MAERYEFSAFCFEVGPDPQNPKQQRVLVFKDGLPFTDLHGAQVTKKFAAKAGPERVEQFCRRFAQDDAFRTQTLLKHAFACC
ncbi:MAG: hypothetical protein Q8O35_06690 [Humidesulfovibrio sp.]|jgi:hypothetical protein|uniref:hypothetical protein n=1 Tax=Humidesulfovibrio sp. TaxID=2910988 RepID=UPI0027347AB8|nr:hypothetical protein [Humidesulfovibrio sp.]MDP2847865.1 hypothetical protein [Humidesulfovibrio sp.]